MVHIHVHVVMATSYTVPQGSKTTHNAKAVACLTRGGATTAAVVQRLYHGVLTEDLTEDLTGGFTAGLTEDLSGRFTGPKRLEGTTTGHKEKLS